MPNETIIPTLTGEFEDDPNSYPNRPVPIIYRNERIGTTLKQGDRVTFQIHVIVPATQPIIDRTGDYRFETVIGDDLKVIEIRVHDR